MTAAAELLYEVPDAPQGPEATFPDVEAELGWRRCEARVKRMRSLGNNWDLAGASAPPIVVIRAALDFLAGLRAGPVPTNVGATPNGGIVFEWDSPALFVEAEIEDARFVHWMFDHPGRRIEHETEVIGTTREEGTDDLVVASERGSDTSSS